MRKRLIPGLLWGILGTTLPTLAYADPIQLVTFGNVDAHEGDDTFSLLGSGFRLGGEIHGIGQPLSRCRPCSPGTSIDLSASAPPEIFGEPAVFDGVTYEGYSIYGGPFFSGNLAFEAGPVTAPDIPLDGYAERTAPFTFTGVLRAFDNFELTGDPLFTANLRGSGIATLAFSRSADFGLTASRVSWEFEDTAPVPEPATMFLLGSGLAGVAMARRRRGRLTPPRA